MKRSESNDSQILDAVKRLRLLLVFQTYVLSLESAQLRSTISGQKYGGMDVCMV